MNGIDPFKNTTWKEIRIELHCTVLSFVFSHDGPVLLRNCGLRALEKSRLFILIIKPVCFLCVLW